MKKLVLNIKNIPAVLWGDTSDSVYIFVHGKMSNKESAREFAQIAAARGHQVLSFDLPEHGERKDEKYPCTVQNGVSDLTTVGQYVRQKWENMNLFACSLGAYFSLLAYKDLPLQNCLFQSPILNMEQLIRNMFIWFNVTEDILQEKREIPTAIDTLSWNYFCYVKEHPIEKWDAPTAILYGSEDTLQSRAVIDRFVEKFRCRLTVSDGSEHYFGSEEQVRIVNEWLCEQIVPVILSM